MANNCGKEPNKAFQRARWLQWQACMSGAPLDKSFGVRKRSKGGIVDRVMGAIKGD